MHIAFLSPSLPWSFGPYAQQLALVAAALGDMGHELSWISMLARLRNETYGEAVLKTLLEAPGADEPPHPLEGMPVVYTGTGVAQCGVDVSAMYTSTLNAMLRRLHAEVMISLMDHNRIFVDAPISVPSLAWFPDHYEELDMHHRHAFSAYSVVVALSPSSAAKVRRTMPWKRVEWIPHVVELPERLVHSRRPTREQLRASFGLPAESFVAFVAFGNYDQHNRKSVDVSLLAFGKLLRVAPDAKLLIHAVSADAVFNGTTAAKASPGLDLLALLKMAALPHDAVVLSTARVPYFRVLEMMSVADVLLQPSKTEGFGMPVLEAQLLGVPVITTAFAAMADYTIYGTAVPSVQPYYYPMGWAATPSLDGVSTALVQTYRGHTEGSRAAAQAYVGEHMSLEAVATRFNDVILTSIARKPRHKRLAHEIARLALPTAVRQAQGAHHPIAKIKRPWVLLFAKEGSDTVDEAAIAHAIRQATAAAADATAQSDADAQVDTDGVDTRCTTVTPPGTQVAEACGSASKSATVSADADAVLFLALDPRTQQPLPPTRRSPLLVRTAWLRATLQDAANKPPGAIGRALDDLADATMRGEKGTFKIVAAVPKLAGGC